MISHNHKCVFVHIPKCGGQSVEHIFLDDLGLGWKHRSPLLLRMNDDPKVGPPRLAHLTHREYIQYCYLSKSLWNEYLTFAVVRNPYSRTESYYKYLGYQGAVSFERFVCNSLPKLVSGDMAWFLMPQVHYIISKNDEIAVDKVIMLEQINQTLPSLLAQLGINLSKIPRANESKPSSNRNSIPHRLRMLRQGVFEPNIHVNSTIEWTPDARSVVNRIYKRDFETLGYDLILS